MASRIFTWSVRNRLLQCKHKVQVQCRAGRFHEKDHRGGYDTKIRTPYPELVKVSWLLRNKCLLVKVNWLLRNKHLAVSMYPPPQSTRSIHVPRCRTPGSDVRSANIAFAPLSRVSSFDGCGISSNENSSEVWSNHRYLSVERAVFFSFLLLSKDDFTHLCDVLQNFMETIGPEFKKWRFEQKEKYIDWDFHCIREPGVNHCFVQWMPNYKHKPWSSLLSDLRPFQKLCVVFKPGDYEIPFKFNTREMVDSWTVTCDSDHNEGYSFAHFELGKNKTGIFHGHLDKTVPKDGKTKYAGYANIRCPRNTVSGHLCRTVVNNASFRSRPESRMASSMSSPWP